MTTFTIEYDIRASMTLGIISARNPKIGMVVKQGANGSGISFTWIGGVRALGSESNVWMRNVGPDRTRLSADMILYDVVTHNRTNEDRVSNLADRGLIALNVWSHRHRTMLIREQSEILKSLRGGTFVDPVVEPPKKKTFMDRFDVICDKFFP